MDKVWGTIYTEQVIFFFFNNPEMDGPLLYVKNPFTDSTLNITFMGNKILFICNANYSN